MNIQQFANKAKLKIVADGNKFAYITADSPNCTFTGYRTENSARKAWLRDTVGEHMAKVILSLLKDTP